MANVLRSSSYATTTAEALVSERARRAVSAIESLEAAYRTRGGSTPLRGAHRDVGRAFAAIARLLAAEAAIPGDEGALARHVYERHFQGGLAFTQLPYPELVAEATARLVALRSDPNAAALPTPCRSRIEAAGKVLRSVPAPPARGAGSEAIRLPALIQAANGAVHAYIRLVKELAGIEMSEERAAGLIAALNAHPETLEPPSSAAE